MWQANRCLTLFLVSGAPMVMDRMWVPGVRREKLLLSCERLQQSELQDPISYARWRPR